ncbi:MAG: hypothetical protein NTU64_16920 [Hyphomicrobiales bacterium]|nr:hypothetical protein [Hyphomicrobiales bacterium]
MQIAVHAFDCQPVLPDRCEITSARDEENIVPGRRHARAEITADGTRRHCRDTHAFNPCDEFDRYREKRKTSLCILCHAAMMQ